MFFIDQATQRFEFVIGHSDASFGHPVIITCCWTETLGTDPRLTWKFKRIGSGLQLKRWGGADLRPIIRAAVEETFADQGIYHDRVIEIPAPGPSSEYIITCTHRYSSPNPPGLAYVMKSTVNQFVQILSRRLAELEAANASAPDATAAPAAAATTDTPTCNKCGFRMIMHGSCWKCVPCGTTSGCS